MWLGAAATAGFGGGTAGGRAGAPGRPAPPKAPPPLPCQAQNGGQGGGGGGNRGGGPGRGGEERHPAGSRGTGGYRQGCHSGRRLRPPSPAGPQRPQRPPTRPAGPQGVGRGGTHLHQQLLHALVPPVQPSQRRLRAAIAVAGALELLRLALQPVQLAVACGGVCAGGGGGRRGGRALEQQRRGVAQPMRPALAGRAAAAAAPPPWPPTHSCCTACSTVGMVGGGAWQGRGGVGGSVELAGGREAGCGPPAPAAAPAAGRLFLARRPPPPAAARPPRRRGGRAGGGAARGARAPVLGSGACAWAPWPARRRRVPPNWPALGTIGTPRAPHRLPVSWHLRKELDLVVPHRAQPLGSKVLRCGALAVTGRGRVGVGGDMAAPARGGAGAGAAPVLRAAAGAPGQTGRGLGKRALYRARGGGGGRRAKAGRPGPAAAPEAPRRRLLGLLSRPPLLPGTPISPRDSARGAGRAPDVVWRVPGRARGR